MILSINLTCLAKLLGIKIIKSFCGRVQVPHAMGLADHDGFFGVFKIGQGFFFA